MKGFKKCNNGHYYKDDLANCPYCPSSKQPENGDAATEIASNGKNTDSDNKTEVMEGMGNASTIIDDDTDIQSAYSNNRQIGTDDKTGFWDSQEVETEGGKKEVKKEYRSSRKLVGWLVSYSFDSMGVDFKLYEGRNTIGRKIDCNITVNDKTMTGKHATILFRSGKYKIKDELSSHGTFVNDIDIEDENHPLNDGDNIKMGETLFKFKSSL